jgi:hypothetical protein
LATDAEQGWTIMEPQPHLNAPAFLAAKDWQNVSRRAHRAEPTGYWVEIIDLATRRSRILEETASCWSYGWPAWSSDGERLSATARRPDGREATVVVAPDGTVLERDPRLVGQSAEPSRLEA